MNVGAPILDAIPGTRGLVLQALSSCGEEQRPSGREIARLAGLPASTVANVLADLVQSGIVTMYPHPNSYGYQLNPDHLLVEAILDLASTHVRLTRKIRDRVREWKIQPEAAWLYGSTARGDGDRGSDIDLLFVWPDRDFDRDVWDEQQIDALVVYVNGLTGNFVQIAQRSLDEILNLERERSSFTANLRVDGIDLIDGSWQRIDAARHAVALSQAS